jgi:ParB-like chromosome segregation protein Spo0J
MGNGIEFNTDVGRGATTFQAYPEEILLDPELNGRHEPTDVLDLAADIGLRGQSTPVVCRKDDKGNPVLVFGHRRYQAIHLLNEQNPDARRKINFIYRRYTEVEAFIEAISENRFRKDGTPMDDANNMEILQRRFGKTVEDIAKVYFPEAKTPDELKASLKFVKDRLALIELAPEAQTAVREKRIKITAAVKLSKLNREQQKKRVAKEGKIKGSDIDSPKGKKAKTKPGKIAPALKAIIDSLLETADFESYDERKTVWISVHAEQLVALKNYLTPEK